MRYRVHPLSHASAHARAHARAHISATGWNALLLSLIAGCATSGTGTSGTGTGTSGTSTSGTGTSGTGTSGTGASGAGSVVPADGGSKSGASGDASASGGDASVGTDAAADAGVVLPCSAPGLLFCDDFESLPLGAAFNAPWSTVGVAGTSAITVDDSVPAHSGTHSVLTHPSSDSFQTLLVYHDPAVLPVASERFYLRAQIRFGAPMSAGHNSFLIADLFSAPGAGMTQRVGEDNQMLMMSVGGDANTYLSNQSFYQDGLPGVQFPAGNWVCFEMMSDASSGSFDVWVNGQEVPDMHVTNLTHENYDTLRFGFEKYAGPVTDIWWDDVAIGTQPIGCD